MDKMREPDVAAEWDNETLKFRWSKVDGAKSYILSVRNIANPDRLLIKTEVPGSKCIFSKKMDEDLKYGETCEAMLKVIGLAYNETETQWKRYIIGGPEVPRNLKAVTDFEDPQRSVKLSWDVPDQRPTSYEVVSIPQTGKRRMLTCNESSVTFPRLKRSTRYQFMVMAVYVTSSTMRKSFGCKTNFISTYTKENSIPIVQYSSAVGSKLNRINISFPVPDKLKTGNNQTNSLKPELSDVPQNLEMVMSTEEGELEMGQIFWHHPTFSGKPDDYEISQYQVIVKEDDKKLPYSPTCNVSTTQTEKFIINLGKRYTVLLRTTYEELDTEKVSVSELREDFYSKPAPPSVTFKEDGETVLISWQAAAGATQYRLEVFNSATNEVILAEEGGKIFLTKQLELDKKLFRGRSYIANVTAMGKSSRNNSAKVHMFIGGDRVPRSPKAALNCAQPFTAIDLSWEEPFEKPQSYIVQVEGGGESLTTKTTQCTVEGLDPGTKYRFTVFAVYNGQKEPHGSCTDEITTHAKPSKVSGIELSEDTENPDTSLHAQWAEVDGCTRYKVHVKTEDFLLEQVTADNKLKIDGLRPNTHYEVSLSAGNGDVWSEVTSQSYCTGLSPPRNIKLSCDRCNAIRIAFSGSTVTSMTYSMSLHKEDGELVTEVHTTKNQCVFEDLTGNTKYLVKIKSVSGSKLSKQVESDVILTLPAPVGFTEVKWSASHPTMDIELKWENNGCDEQEIEISADGETERRFIVEGTDSCRYRCLEEGRTYQARIRSRNSSGFGSWSTMEYVALGEE